LSTNHRSIVAINEFVRFSIHIS